MPVRTGVLACVLVVAGCVHIDIEEVPVRDDAWSGLTRESVQLNHKLLVVKGSKGIVVCPYLDIKALEATGEAAAIISSPDFDGLPDAQVIAVTTRGEALGLRVGMAGRDAFDLIR